MGSSCELPELQGWIAKLANGYGPNCVQTNNYNLPDSVTQAIAVFGTENKPNLNTIRRTSSSTELPELPTAVSKIVNQYGSSCNKSASDILPGFQGGNLAEFGPKSTKTTRSKDETGSGKSRGPYEPHSLSL
jgi:hypothetical protein